MFVAAEILKLLERKNAWKKITSALEIDITASAQTR